MRLALPALALLLAACGGGGDQGTEISIKGGDGSNFSAGMSKDGAIAIDAPGFKGSITLPKIQLDADNFDINGVKLPPGSKIDVMNVAGGKEEGVRVGFTSPIGPGEVRQWFEGKLAAAGVKVSASADGLAGTTSEGKPFTLSTRPADGGASTSTITIGT